MKKHLILAFASLHFTLIILSQPFQPGNSPRVQTTNGTLEGIYSSGISIFKGVPFAAPPLGRFRWKEPQPVKSWDGIRDAKQFGPRAMQLPVFSDIVFRSNGVSEDCLYLNIWTPAKSGTEQLPVLVYFYGGGFIAGDGSEYRYDGENMARHGVVAVTVNYRLSVFGFFVHPDLTKESPNHASGNYGLLDQSAALQWVSKNIAAFGGDPRRITIAGESAGSFSVSAQMASPLSKHLIAGAIGESGSILGIPVSSLANAEAIGEKFARSMGAESLEALRAIPAEKILEATKNSGAGRFPVVVDGYFFPKQPAEIFATGQQAQVPLLYGWNTLEGSYQDILRGKEATVENFIGAVKSMYGESSEQVLAEYKPTDDSDVKQVASDLASDQFIGYGTWKWGELQATTGGHPVYRYLFGKPRPAKRSDTSTHPHIASGAVHSAEIEYAMGNLPTNKVYDWQPADYMVSQIIQSYFVNFIKTGDPNGLGLPNWPAQKAGKTSNYIYIDKLTQVLPDKTRGRYLMRENWNK